MTFFSLINAERVTVATDAIVVPASEVESLASASDTARRLSAPYARAETRLAEAERKARAAGRREGLAAGTAAASEELDRRLLELERETERERQACRERAVDNALEIVRRIASTLGEDETIAALAWEAAHTLLPRSRVVVQVHPDRLERVRERLADRLRADAAAADGTALEVEAEESLGPDQCRLLAPNGTAVLAGLETQLRALERHARGAAADVG